MKIFTLVKWTGLILCTTLFFNSVASAQIITTVAGTQKSACPTVPCGDGGLATDAKLYSPAGMTVGPNNDIYIAEYSNHAVRKIDYATGIITTIAGTQRTACTTAPCGDGGLASNALLKGPRGLNVDAEGNLYIADFSNHCIRKIDFATGIITTVAGTIQSSCPAAPCGDGGLATDARLNNPTGVGFDAEGHMYVVDYGNHCIRKVDKNTGIITTVAGLMKQSCSAAPCGDGGAATAAQFNGPSAIDFDSEGNMFVAEYGNHSVRKITMTTGIITTYAGTQRASCSVSPCGDGGSATSTDARLLSPFSLRIGPDDNLYIADASNAAIRKVDKTTGIITTVAGITKSTCSAPPCGDGGLATLANLANPFSVDFNSLGNMYILEYSNQALRMVTPASPLPVTMTDLKARKTGEIVDIFWKSLNEMNVSTYHIERSENGNQFRTIGTLPAIAHGTPEWLYSWKDLDPIKGDNFYRIKTTDMDGSSSFSETLRISMQGAISIKIFPNPVSGGVLNLQVNANQGATYTVSLYDAVGKQILSQPIKIPIGASTAKINLPSQLSEGVYFAQIRNGTEPIHREMIIIQK